MKKEVIMPKIGLDMDEGTILTWYKKVGDPVKKGDVYRDRGGRGCHSRYR
jgi:pyruvate/2-oxoglutarate dehydrogenase complex dihydrolipoamide acyltransferase (E2) component